MQKIYLACPYTHPQASIREYRERQASLAAAYLMQQGFVVFSPITHGHAVADHLPEPMWLSHEFWMQQCLPLVAACDGLVILPLSGWKESRGMAEEFNHARRIDLPIHIWQSTTKSSVLTEGDFHSIDDCYTIQGVLPCL